MYLIKIHIGKILILKYNFNGYDYENQLKNTIKNRKHTVALKCIIDSTFN